MMSGGRILKFRLFSRYVLIFSILIATISCRNPVPPPTIPESPQTQPSHHVHAESEIPTPLAELRQSPLDMLPNCGNDAYCPLLILYSDSLELLDWKKSESKRIALPAPTNRSRNPSGKLIQQDANILVIHTNFDHTLCFDKKWNPCKNFDASSLPKAAPGLNYFEFSDGRFYDLQYLPDNKLAVIETNNRLSLAGTGNLISTQEKVGGVLGVNFPVFYTSAATLPGQTDAIMKFIYENDAFFLEKSEPVMGEILDLTVSDLNRDGKMELLAAVRTREGSIFIQVMNAP
jgi:hypothetical protein